MAYHELIKNFNRIRDYMREFYVYGFKRREEYHKKSARSYDDERRRMESWLGEFMQFHRTADGKNVFLSIDSRSMHHNPLYKAWKTKSFTDGDITLHFMIFDILAKPDNVLSLQELMAEMDKRLLSFEKPRYFDESTIRKKLKEYVKEGIVVAEKRGKTMFYRRAAEAAIGGTKALDFFSEVAPCGVIGSYILDKVPVHEESFAFKHHYITGAMDSEILRKLFAAIEEKREISLETIHRRSERISERQVVPLKILVSVQSGRQYLMAYSERFHRIKSYRIDNILSVKPGEVSESFEKLRKTLDGMRTYMWGVSTQSDSGQRMETVEFTVTYEAHETFIHQRLEREKRCGTVEQIAPGKSRFFAQVYDAGELIPWIRTFICRISDIHFSNKTLEKRFLDDLEAMYALYDVEGGEDE